MLYRKLGTDPSRVLNVLQLLCVVLYPVYYPYRYILKLFYYT